MKQTALIIGLLFLFSSWNYDRRFPDFTYQTVEGNTITNDFFKNSNTLVVHFHLGCFPAMVLLKDLQLLDENELMSYKILLIAENTNSQITEFNSDEENNLSEIRKALGIQKVTYDFIGECLSEKYVEINGEEAIAPGCRKIARKLRISSSPVILKVNSEGRIVGKFEGYTITSNVTGLKEIIRNL